MATTPSESKVESVEYLELSTMITPDRLGEVFKEEVVKYCEEKLQVKLAQINDQHVKELQTKESEAEALRKEIEELSEVNKNHVIELQTERSQSETLRTKAQQLERQLAQSSEDKHRQKGQHNFKMRLRDEEAEKKTREANKATRIATDKLEKAQDYLRWMAWMMSKFCEQFRSTLREYYQSARCIYQWLTSMEKGARLEEYQRPVLSRDELTHLCIRMLGMSKDGDVLGDADWWRNRNWEEIIKNVCTNNEVFGNWDPTGANNENGGKEVFVPWTFTEEPTDDDETPPHIDLMDGVTHPLAFEDAGPTSFLDDPDHSSVELEEPSSSLSTSSNTSYSKHTHDTPNSDTISAGELEDIHSASTSSIDPNHVVAEFYKAKQQESVITDELASQILHHSIDYESSPVLTFTVPEEGDSDMEEMEVADASAGLPTHIDAGLQNNLEDPEAEELEADDHHGDASEPDVLDSVDSDTEHELHTEEDAGEEYLSNANSQGSSSSAARSVADTENSSPTPSASTKPSSTTSTDLEQKQKPKKKNKKSANRKAKANESKYEKKKTPAAEMTADQKAAKNAKRREQKARAAERKTSASTS